jgi:O-antigen ligase/Tfp pilus assembly protein PilF
MQSVTFKKLTKHPLIFAAIGWTTLLLVKFFPMIPQPETVIGYLWKPEFFLSAFLFASILWLWKADKLKRLLSFSKDEFYFIILPIILFVVWSGFSVFWAISPRNALHHTLLWACYLIFYTLIRQIAQNSTLEKYSIYGVGIVISILSLSCFIEYLGYLSGGTNTALGYLYSKFGEICVTLLPVFLLGCIDKSNSKAKICAGFSVTTWLLIQCSFSRTQFLLGIFCLISVFAYCLIFKLFNKTLKLAFGFILLTACFVQLITFFSQNQVNSLSRLVSSNDELAKISLNTRPVLLGISLEVFKQNPILGVGGDNFIVAFKEGRENYSATRIENPSLNVGEDVVLERSHNEYAQILSELGIVGILIFAWLLFGITRLAFNLRNNYSPKAFASLLGVAAFLTSSLATSFSFRVSANALAFFFVLAIAVKQLSGREKIKISAPNFQPVFASAAVSLCLALMVFSAIRGISLMYQSFAQSAEDEFIAEDYYKKALYFDEKEAVTNYDYGMFLTKNKRYNEAIPYLRSAIDNGISTSTSYYDLAAAQLLAKKSDEAEKTLAESVRVYPRSVFARTTFASLLKQNGKLSESKENLDIALKINESDAKTWWILNNEGIENVTEARLKAESITIMSDLNPQNGMYAVMDYQTAKNPNIARKK